VTLTSSKKFTINGLTPAGIYFQIRTLGKLGYTDWMDTKTFVVAYQRRGAIPGNRGCPSRQLSRIVVEDPRLGILK
jgi:hypothetical protein